MELFYRCSYRRNRDMEDLASAVTKLQDHLTQSIGSEMLEPYSFERFVHNGLVLHHAGTTLTDESVEERCSTCVAASVAETFGSRNSDKWVPLSPYIPPTTTRAPHSPGSGTPTKPHRHYPPHPHHPKARPHTCNTTFDAISVIRRELFIFKDNYFWRLNEQGLMKNYPVEIKRFWPESGLERVDAVYERQIDTKIVFFSGTHYWLFNGNRKEYGYPRPLTDLGLPPDLKKIDAAMVWGYNGKTYLFSGTQYWRYDESEGRVELDYPRDMAMWRGVPYHIDAAFQHTDGRTYFFKGKRFWEFNDKLMTVKKNKYNDINQHWFGCPSRTEAEIPDVHDEGKAKEDPEVTSSIGGISTVISNFLTIASFATTLLFYRTRLCLFQ